MLRVTKEQESAFWSKVRISDSTKDCWPWTGARKPTGYGNVRINRKDMLAHRVAYMLSTGDIPDGLYVCHSCDNPPCCNPRHLMLGTRAANFADMLIKGRQGFHKNKAIGERNTNARLSPEAVAEIRSLYKSGTETQAALAKLFGVSQPCIGAVVRNETWRHI